MKYLVFGLGNPDEEYFNTRHNIGFQVLDYLASSKDAVFEVQRYAAVAKIRHKGRTIVLIKPNTYMNLSGKAVNYHMQNENCSLSNILVLTDDLALPLGQIRLRSKGGDAGHNGLRDIIEKLGTQNFCRLRFGIGNEFPRGKQVDFVLGQWTENEHDVLKKRIPLAAEAVMSFATLGPGETMNLFNNK